MRIIIKNFKDNEATALRRAGYAFQRTEGVPASTRGDIHSSTRGGEMSFIREFSRSGYPRFHIYARMENSDLMINLHLDQKKETYGKGPRHHGEYEESSEIKEEADRLKSLLN